MKRFRVHDGDESYYVECATEMEAIPGYRIQKQAWLDKRANDPTGKSWWERYGSKIKPVDDGDLSVLEIGQREHEFGPRPECCIFINEIPKLGNFPDSDGPYIQLKIYETLPPEYWELRKRPHWTLRKIGLEIEFCPFCGTELPSVEEKPDEDKPHPVRIPNDGCETCDDSWCECNPPSSHYKLKK